MSNGFRIHKISVSEHEKKKRFFFSICFFFVFFILLEVRYRNQPLVNTFSYVMETPIVVRRTLEVRGKRREILASTAVLLCISCVAVVLLLLAVIAAALPRPADDRRGDRKAARMVLKPQTLRNWKIFTGLATGATAFHTVFRVDYGPHDHCFTGVSRRTGRSCPRTMSLPEPL